MLEKMRLLPISNHLLHSPSLIVENIAWRIPFFFELSFIECKDFPLDFCEGVKFVNKATKTSFYFEKKNKKPPENILDLWLEKANNLIDQNEEIVFPLIIHLQILLNYWMYEKEVYLDFKSLEHHSLQWYKACFVYNKTYYERNLNNEDLYQFIQSLIFAKSQIYLENISLLTFLAIKSNYRGKEVLDPELFKIWRSRLAESSEDTINSRKVSEFIVDGAEATYAQLMYAYTQQHLANTEYFASIESKLLPNSEVSIKNIVFKYSTRISFFETIYHDYYIKLSKLDLLKFCSHLFMISHSIPLISIAGLNNKEDFEEYKKFYFDFLFKQGFISSTKMAIIGKCYERNKLEVKKEFIDAVLQTRKEFAYEKYGVNVFDLSEQETREIINLFNAELSQQDNDKKKITKFGALEALILFNKTLDNIENTPNLDYIKRLVEDCFVIAYQTSKMLPNGEYSSLKEKADVFNFAKELASKLINGEYTFIFQVVIRKHAFYVAIKSDNKDYKILIVDGAGLNTHKRDSSIAAGEYEDPSHGPYYAIVSEALDKNKAKYQEFLQHYIYKLITSNITENARKNIVLLNETNGDGIVPFSGFAEKSFVLPSFKQSGTTFLAQTSDNCVIHNLKNIIKSILNMSKAEYGIFENELLKGADRMISELLASARLENEHMKNNGNYKLDSGVGNSFVENWFEDIETDSIEYISPHNLCYADNLCYS